MDERELEYYVAVWQLVPSSGGVFEVVVNGELLFSKKALGRHAEPGEIKKAFRDFLQGALAGDAESE